MQCIGDEMFGEVIDNLWFRLACSAIVFIVVILVMVWILVGATESSNNYKLKTTNACADALNLSASQVSAACTLTGNCDCYILHKGWKEFKMNIILGD